ncbi:hypothetical protein A3752_21700 [Oleiphilus sp. HI0081]|nr:hypothetical protein A3752_21700 [Oleiphilus sp. HI0081]
MRTILKDWAEDIISRGRAVDALGLNYTYVQTLFRLHCDNRCNNTNKLWVLLLLIQFELGH